VRDNRTDFTVEELVERHRTLDREASWLETKAHLSQQEMMDLRLIKVRKLQLKDLITLRRRQDVA
jgi:uncharacterized protein YdcH (DUF465 family)|tara:strand:- start:747 stop:941 length:195 start_codon:yes stop_codon:yes gene_type:complete